LHIFICNIGALTLAKVFDQVIMRLLFLVTLIHI
jgi:hypothetical protein